MKERPRKSAAEDKRSHASPLVENLGRIWAESALIRAGKASRADPLPPLHRRG